MKILTLTDAFWPDHTGGISKSLLPEVLELAARGHDIHVVTRKLSRGLPDHEMRDSYHLYRYRSPHKGTILYRTYPLFSLNIGPKLIDRLNSRFHFDVAYVHNPFQAVGLLKSSKKIPYVYVFHAPTTREIELDAAKGKYGLASPLVKAVNLWIKGIEKKALEEANTIVVRSKFMEGQMHQLHGKIGNDKTVCIPLCVDTNRFSFGDRYLRRNELKLPINRPILLTVRRLVSRMGLETLIAAMSYVARDIPDTLLLIGGKGYLEEALKLQVSKLNLNSNIHFVGFIPEDELPKYYQAADLFVLPTEALEGFGLVTIESLSCGTPVIATPIGANPEVLNPLDSEFICKDASPHALADRIIEFIGKRDDIGLRMRCREYCVTNFHIDKVVDRIENVLQEVAKI